MIELRIDNQLCDLPDDFTVTLKRTFYDPTQLTTKDAQRSYMVTLPATDTNKRAFDFKNLQEVQNKFGKFYKASLVINSQMIFEGDFRLDEITPDRFTGNLTTIFKYSLKDILADKYMNECGEWRLPFKNFNASAKEYNEKANSECIFPLVMYGLLPKNIGTDGEYSAKDVYDATVAYKMGAFPPSINCVQMLQNVFSHFGLNLSGTGLSDPRLSQLYMSYKNPSDYEMEWNYGYNAIIKLKGKWSNYRNINIDHNIDDWRVEPTTSINNNPKNNGTAAIYNTDLLSTVNGDVDIVEDYGGNVDSSEAPPSSTNIPEHRSHKIRIPYTGYYKVSFYAEFKYDTTTRANQQKTERFGDKSISIISPQFYDPNNVQDSKNISDITRRRSEIKVVRDRSNGSFEFSEMDIDMAYYEDAIGQTPDFDTEEVRPKYYPRGGEMCFIDPKQTKQLVCGIGFGKGYGNQNNAYTEQSNEKEIIKYTNPIATKGGYSYDGADIEYQYTASPSDGYMECILDESGNRVYTQSTKYKENITNTNTYSCANADLRGGFGQVETIVWLNRGEELTVVHTCDLDRNIWTRKWGSDIQDVSFTLSIEPFKKSQSWLTDKLNASGDETIVEIDYNDKTDFESDNINLIKFLPSNIKINDWVTNFCNAFNLSLIQIDDTHYEMNTNKRLASYGSRYIDISSKLYQGYKPQYKPLDIPRVYDLGFSTNQEEQGYIETKENGGGKFQTWRADGNTLTQTSSFSYCWYKNITFDVSTQKGVLKIPVISNKEPFALPNSRDYAEMMKKDYSDYTQRFWYKADNIVLPNVNSGTLTVSLVKGALDNEITLDYHDEDLSILRNYFAVITGSETSYTEIVCYLEQWEFNMLSSSFVIFNNDLFFVSGVDTYNPITKIAQLKLIRKSIL